MSNRLPALLDVSAFGWTCIPCFTLYFTRLYLSYLLYCTYMLCLFTVFSLLGESPRWLLAEGRSEEALKEIKKAARMNKKEVPESLFPGESKSLINVSTQGSSVFACIDALHIS